MYQNQPNIKFFKLLIVFLNKLNIIFLCKKYIKSNLILLLLFSNSVIIFFNFLIFKNIKN